MGDKIFVEEVYEVKYYFMTFQKSGIWEEKVVIYNLVGSNFHPVEFLNHLNDKDKDKYSYVLLFWSEIDEELFRMYHVEKA